MQKNQKLGRKVFYYYLSKRILTGIILLIISILFLFFKEPALAKILFFLSKETAVEVIRILNTMLFIISFVFIIGGFLLAWIKYISCTFDLSDIALSIKRGIFNKKEISIPFRQIQNVNIEQDFVERMMGTCKLIVQTAGNDNSNQTGEDSGIFDMIDFNLAKKIRETLLLKTNTVDTHEQPIQKNIEIENKHEATEENGDDYQKSFTI